MVLNVGGSVVGWGIGKAVGEGVGMTVSGGGVGALGTCVGGTVGVGIGSAVGSPGATVGDGIGRLVGAGTGNRVGVIVGTGDGDVDGSGDGAGVGENVATWTESACALTIDSRRAARGPDAPALASRRRAAAVWIADVKLPSLTAGLCTAQRRRHGRSCEAQHGEEYNPPDQLRAPASRG